MFGPEIPTFLPRVVDPSIREHREIRAGDIPEVAVDAEVGLARDEARMKERLPLIILLIS